MRGDAAGYERLMKAAEAARAQVGWAGVTCGGVEVCVYVCV